MGYIEQVSSKQGELKPSRKHTLTIPLAGIAAELGTKLAERRTKRRSAILVVSPGPLIEFTENSKVSTSQECSFGLNVRRIALRAFSEAVAKLEVLKTGENTSREKTEGRSELGLTQ